MAEVLLDTCFKVDSQKGLLTFREAPFLNFHYLIIYFVCD